MLGIYFKSMGPDTLCRVEARGVRVGMQVGQILGGIFGLQDCVPKSSLNSSNSQSDFNNNEHTKIINPNDIRDILFGFHVGEQCP
jgi:hypothetical protein